ncbi:hypothetical protein PISMIDRAFT_677180 [Pisolithus microcarpus 441]|uniref:Uncharacterized protein n=1 Tax=Pisolithus microcarpus 441 TaxID=765257 RepID=A0A0C9ZTH1_9AGAM|nr:hypothetical protein PISMIDRAFT_677180 [Pisolithus microcarpus 441]
MTKCHLTILHPPPTLRSTQALMYMSFDTPNIPPACAHSMTFDDVDLTRRFPTALSQGT